MRTASSCRLAGRPLRRLGASSLTLACLAGVVAFSAGCRGERSDKPPRQFLPDMDTQAKVKAQSRTPFFEDNRSARQPVAGAVPFGRVIGVNADAEEPWAQPWLETRRAMLKDGVEEFHGITSDGRFLDRIPASVRVDEQLLLRGKEKFGIYCAVCHGYDGGGRGTVGVRWSVPAANLHDAKYLDVTQRTGKDGYLFDVVRNGVWDNVLIEDGRVLHYSATGTPENPGQWRMAGYRSKVSEHDAWAIVSYIRVLQSGRASELDQVPDAQDRERLRDRWQRESAGGQGGQPTSGGDATDATENNG